MKKIFTFFAAASFALAANAQVTLMSQFVNPCGNDGSNEFIVATTGAAGVNIANLAIGSGGSGTAASDNINFWWAGSNVPGAPAAGSQQNLTGTGPYGISGYSASASETCANSGLECYGFRYPSIAADATNINAIISALNTAAGCTVFLPVPNTNTIPPNSKFVVMLGAGDCGLDAPATNLNFSNHCPSLASRQYYVVVGRGDGGSGSSAPCTSNAGGYFSNSSPRTGYISVYNGSTATNANTVGTNYTTNLQTYTPSTVTAGNAGLMTPGTTGTATWVGNQGCVPAPNVLALPILLTQFNAKVSGKDVIINWTSALEINNDVYVLERAINNNEFQTIATIKGAGNSTNLNNYTYTDKDNTRGVVAYRLKQIDFDGRFSVSSVVFVAKVSGLEILKAYPMPANDVFSLQLINDKNAEVEINIVGVNGQVVMTQKNTLKQGINEVTMNVGEIANGVYMVFIKSNNTVATTRLVK